MKVLVTGQAGSGKSSVAAELARRGFAAYDTDAMPEVTGFDSVETGVPPTREEISHPIDFSRVADGRIAEHWAQFDLMALMQQIGAFPAP